jgi:protein-S-isoprenylcysteine O-methyltransferase Ste14
VVVYFGFTCIAMLVVAGAVQRIAAARGPLRLARALLPALVATLPLLGVVNVASPLFLSGAAAQDALGNVTEWWGALAFTVFFVLLAWLWRATRFSARLESGAR